MIKKKTKLSPFSFCIKMLNFLPSEIFQLVKNMQMVNIPDLLGAVNKDVEFIL